MHGVPVVVHEVSSRDLAAGVGMESIEEWAEKIFAGDPRAIGRAISAVENGDPSGEALLRAVFPRTGGALIVGITGSPGTGKSTLTDKLALHYRQEGKTLGIIAVDPTSPFTGGAILGDRIRMPALSTDEGVYIRSMANRGRLGGLAAATLDAVSILEASGMDIILVETVGVGQDEVEIAELADVTVLLLVPGTGDSIQSFKAGVMEIADIFVVNKADYEGADRVVQEVTALLEIAPPESPWTPPIVSTVATTGDGVDRLAQAIEDFSNFSREKEMAQDRLRRRWRKRLVELLERRLVQSVMEGRVNPEELGGYVEDIVARKRDPYSVVEEMMRRAGLN